MKQQFYQIHRRILNYRVSSEVMKLLITVHLFFKISKNIHRRKKDHKCKNRMMI